MIIRTLLMFFISLFIYGCYKKENVFLVERKQLDPALVYTTNPLIVPEALSKGSINNSNNSDSYQNNVAQLLFGDMASSISPSNSNNYSLSEAEKKFLQSVGISTKQFKSLRSSLLEESYLQLELNNALVRKVLKEPYSEDLKDKLDLFIHYNG